MNKKLLIILYLVFVYTNAIAQDYRYTVFYISGSAQINQTKKYTNLSRGMVIKDGQLVRLKESSYLILFSEEGNPVTLSIKGTYSFKELKKKESLSKESLTISYIKFLWESMTESESEESNGATGGDTRAAPLMKLPPDSCLIIKDTVVLTWGYPFTTNAIYLTLYDCSGEQLYTIPTHDTAYVYINNEHHKNREISTKWNVDLSSYPNASRSLFLFSFASDSLVKDINIKLKKLRKELVFDDILNHLMLATFYEKNRLYMEAINEYKKMQTKYPSNNNIKQQYSIFLKRCGLFSEKKGVK